jgi:protein-S-isoprenylcysteine O-methyltransferase Ste14
MKLLLQALTKYLAGLILVGVLLFPAAGTLQYWNGWLFIGLLFIPMLVFGIVLFFKAKDLLRSRLGAKEKQTEQKLVILFSCVVFLGGFVVAGLDFRFGWSHLPPGLIIAISVVFLAGYAMFVEVSRENMWLSRTVEVHEGQNVVSTGLYSIVRHPMYTATLLMFLSMPVVLGSLWSFLIFLLWIPILVLRILGEEKMLLVELDGYAAYRQKVKYRLVPFVW